MAKRGAKKEPFEPVRLPLIEKDVRELVAKSHPDLEHATIAVINRPGKVGRSRCDGIVKLRVASTAERALVKDDIGDLAYVVEVRTGPYEKLSPEAKKRRLDHALNHAAGADEKDRWVTVDQHDVELFASDLERHGQPDDNPSFTAVAKQIALFAETK